MRLRHLAARCYLTRERITISLYRRGNDCRTRGAPSPAHTHTHTVNSPPLSLFPSSALMRRIGVATCQRRWLASALLPRAGKCGAPWSGDSSVLDTAASLTTAVREVRSTAVCCAPKDAQYQCGGCGKTFRLVNALNHHIMTRHGNNAKALMKKDGKLVPVETDQLKGGVHCGSSSSSTATASSATLAGAAAAASSSPLSGGATSPFPAHFAAPFGAAAASMGGVAPSFTPPGTAPGVLQAPAAAGGTTASHGDNGNGAVGAAEETEKRMFVCTVCQKTFRLEAALQHHYQAKHNMDMPTSASSPSSLGGASTAPGTGGASASTPGEPGANGGGSAGAFGGVPGGCAEGTAAPANASSLGAAQYVRQQEGALPDAPQYHLDVAPNAPEEGDIAAHWRCVNMCVLMGDVQEVEEGYVFEDHVLQFTVATEFATPAPGDPDMDFHTVRVYGHEFWAPLKADVQCGGRFLVTGRLCMVPQFDTQLKKYYHYPVIQVFPGSGNVVRV
ncbi:putative RNA-editing complex protein [Leishmania mexicana MHOM/GT/2001/U1103]|uniref:RNA-editing complex protein n=1 Tax=Leishmania mexicana (strain MHOM/GT/2001/U1103) TaxID=929439 RepID=E9ALC6_LEIMU|nr:putative RNA-editing complex protein [Leishmania mexicana MHOM/GT/2001/U1103]CBZ23729.1 putative RNA-editing complex protein [Leishmania mexicana MHOM/GT/2001/U1103]